MEEVFVLKIRLKFNKSGLMKYIGHLDLMRGWQKIFRRSGIPIAYSQGFHPHQIFSIAAPLPVGVTSDGEYLDMSLSVEDYSMDDIVTKVNAMVPEGIVILEAVELVGKQTAGMAACKAATYEVTLSEKLCEALLPAEKVMSFIDRDSIIVLKRNKKGNMNELDIKTGIHSFSIEGNKLNMMLATGSSFNIKPELVMNALFTEFKVDMENNPEEIYYSVHRFDIFSSIDPLKTLTEGVS